MTEEEFWGRSTTLDIAAMPTTAYKQPLKPVEDFDPEYEKAFRKSGGFAQPKGMADVARAVAGEALRYDTGKARWDLLPFDGLSELVSQYTMGASTYGDRNWEKGMAYSKCFASLLRHLGAFWQGEDWGTDDKTGKKFRHLTAVVWNALALLVYSIRGIGTDDRPQVIKKEQ